MYRRQGFMGRRPGHGERFLFSLALAAVSLLWITQAMAPWATALCVAGAVGGAAGMLYFGRLHMRSRGKSPQGSGQGSGRA